MFFRKSRWSASIGAALLAGLAAGAFSAAQAQETAGNAGGTIVYGADAEPTNLDPHSTGEIVADPIIRAVFDHLVNQKVDGGFEAWLAREWSISANGLDYRFVLRDDVTFHDGTPFDAEAVAANIHHILTRAPGVNGKIVTVLDKDNPVTVVGPHEVVIHLKTPSAGFLNQVANVGLAIVAPSALAAHPDDIATGAGYVGTGPFKLVSRSIGTNILFERNDDYAWAPESLSHGGPAHIEKLEIRFLTEIQARIGALTSGQIQAAASIPPALVPVIEASRNTAISGQEIAGTSYALWLNSTSGPFSDKRVRQAFQRSLDIDGLIAGIYRGHYRRAWSIAAPLLPNGYDASLENAWPQDTALAEKLLAEAGYTSKDSEGFWTKDGQRLSVRWDYNSSVIREQRDVLGDAIAAEARKHGFEVIRTGLDAGSFTEARKADNYDILDINSQNPDGDSLRLPFFHSAALPKNGGTGNYSNIDNAQLDQWLVDANSTSDAASRWENYAKVQQFAVLEEALVVPLYTTKYLLGHSADTTGWDIGLRAVPFNFYNVQYVGQ